MIRIFFAVVGAMLGQRCSQTTEVSCAGIGGCKWTNYTGKCYGLAGNCDGEPSCEALRPTCNNNPGCSYVSTSPGGCRGTGLCLYQTTKGGCDALDGCAWMDSSDGRCIGAPSTCSGTSATNCQLDGCKYTAEAIPSRCTGSRSRRCEDAINKAGCELLAPGLGCEWKEPKPGQCRLHIEDNWTCDTFNDFGSEAGIYCTLVPGCIYSGNVGMCKGDEISKTCAEFGDDCYTVYTAGCEDEEGGGCTGVIEFDWCDELGYGGSTCTTLGCTSDGVEEGSCSGTIDRSTPAAATDKADCTALGELYRWYDEDEGGCDDPASKGWSVDCFNYTSYGKEMCYNIQCTWETAVAQGCAGTPSVAPTTMQKDCPSFRTAGQATCEGNQCTWIEAGQKHCAGTPTNTCFDQNETVCETIGGCTYSPATNASCTGTNSRLCSGGTSSACFKVHACYWRKSCPLLATKAECDKNSGCAWSQPGGCATNTDTDTDRDADIDTSTGGTSSVYVPVLVLLLLLLALSL